MKTVKNRIEYIGSKIKYYRLLNKISLSKLANDANISKSTLFGLEEGRSNPTISTLVNIASTLDISLNELIGNSLENKNHSSNLTLISIPEGQEYKLYKLTLLSNEFFKLNYSEAYNMEIEVIEGAVSLIDKSITLYSGDRRVVDFNRSFKAYSKDATIILKIYKDKKPFYIKEDIFHNFAHKELLEEIIKNSRDKLVSRVIFTTIKPIEDITLYRYINYIEILSSKESCYYIFKRFQGILGGIKSFANKLNIDTSSKYLKLEEYINSASNNRHLNKEMFNLIDSSVADDTKDIIINIANRSKEGVSIATSIYDINRDTLKNSSYILLLEELIDNTDSKEIATLTLQLYRALESLYVAKVSSLSSNELKLFNMIIHQLPKALYFAYSGYLNQAVNIVNSLILDIDKVKTTKSDSKFINNYIEVADMLKESIRYYENGIDINSVDVVEAVAKDLNLSIDIKELIMPVYSGSGLYAYLFRVN